MSGSAPLESVPTEPLTTEALPPGPAGPVSARRRINDLPPPVWHRRLPRVSRLDGYLGAVGLVGIALIATVLTLIPAALIDVRHFAIVLPLCLVLIVGELRPIAITRGEDSSDEISISSTIGIALVLVAPVGVAILAQGLALAADECRDRTRRGTPPWLRLGFNVGQYSLAFLAARVSFAAITGQPILSGAPSFVASTLPAAWAAVGAFYLVNSGLTSTAFALVSRTPVRSRLWTDLRGQASSSVVLLGLAPVVAQAESWSAWLLPFLLLPLVLVHTSAAVAARREHEALHDALTGLPNRALLLAHLEQVVSTASRDRPAALLFIDLDHFKEVNDTLGHPVGDRLITDVGQRLRLALREGDLLARLGGDEFAVVTHGLSSIADAAELAERLAEALRDPFEADGIRLDVAFSVGIAIAPQHAQTVDLLLQRADVALYGAKEIRGGYAFYDPDRDTHSLQRLVLASDLRRAVEAGTIEVFYQPQVDARTHQPVGVEALIRWTHPVLGAVDPESVVRLAGSTGLLRELSGLVLDEGLAALRRWHDAGLDLTLAVNLTARQLSDSRLLERIVGGLARAGLDASALVLEITESAVMSDQHSLDVVDALRGIGVGLSIDDFGTGFSSLVQLQRLAPDELKVDRSFVQAMATGANERTIVKSTIELGHNLGMRVVAEGVEDEATGQMLTRWGCDMLQGFSFARPRSESETTEWLLAASAVRGGTVVPLTRRA
jgi:diguanylate cyclase (GGDEF)-like protein